MENSVFKKLTAMFLIAIFALCNIMPISAEGTQQTPETATCYVSAQKPIFPLDNNFSSIESNSAYLPVSKELQLTSPVEQNTDSAISVLQNEQKEAEVVQQAETNEFEQPTIFDNTTAPEDLSSNTAEVVGTTTYNIDAITLENIPSYLVESVGLNAVSE